MITYDATPRVPIPISPSWILLMMGSTAFSLGIFWLVWDPIQQNIHGRILLIQGSKNLEFRGAGVPTKMLELY